MARYTGWIPGLSKARFAQHAEAILVEYEFSGLMSELNGDPYAISGEALGTIRIEAQGLRDQALAQMVERFFTDRLPAAAVTEYRDRYLALLRRDANLRVAAGMEEIQHYPNTSQAVDAHPMLSGIVEARNRAGQPVREVVRVPGGLRFYEYLLTSMGEEKAKRLLAQGGKTLESLPEQSPLATRSVLLTTSKRARSTALIWNPDAVVNIATTRTFNDVLLRVWQELVGGPLLTEATVEAWSDGQDLYLFL